MHSVVRLSLIVVVALGLASPAQAVPRDTTVRTIRDTDGDNLLEPAPGEDYVVVGADEDFRPPRNGSILNFLQLSDFQMVDEESPGRVEFLDKTQRGPFNPFSAAYRPQETLTTQITEAMVRAARNTTSPVTGDLLDLAILTGDNADSQQYNETRWFIDILDGTAGPRDPSTLPEDEQLPPDLDIPEDIALPEKIDPNSGIEGTACDLTPGKLYDGVQGGGDTGYYDPDGSDGTDGHGYSPDREENIAETPGRDVTVRDFPGLFEKAQRPFEAVGVDLPWYSAFGNHDALVQGNSPDAYLGPFGPNYAEEGEVSNPAYQAIATGCTKPNDSSFAGSFPPGDPGNFFGTITGSQTVPNDPRRCYLAKDEAGVGAPAPCSDAGWIQQHFLSTGSPVGHGFAPAPCEIDEPIEEEDCAGYGRPLEADLNNDGYYSFSPRTGLRFVVLDTITDECGSVFCSEGSVDDPQFDWLDEQVRMAASMGQYVMVFSHHTLRTIRFPSTDPTEYDIHYGQRFDRENPANPQNVSLVTLEDLFCSSPNVLAHIAGHEHENYVEEHNCTEPPLPGFTNEGGFVHVSTAAHIDYPQQSRMIELVDNGNDTISLVLTMLDHDGPANPGGMGEAGEQVLKLASIGRELGYNDYQGNRGATGDEVRDRNAIIVFDRPWPFGTE
jgi:3',5'-cyclic AMP phosphodiesterase CpdA